MKYLDKIIDRITGRIDPDKLVTCDYMQCTHRGDYICCIYDKIPDCDIYRAYLSERREKCQI